jgi:hypothetical protein
MSDSEKDPFEGTSWARDPHRGTVWSNEPFKGTVWEDRTSTWTERIKREKGSSRDLGESTVPGRSSTKRGPFCILLAFLWVGCLFYGHSAVAGAVNSVMAGNDWESTRHFSLQLLRIFVTVFAPISFIMVAAIAFVAMGRGLFGFLGMMLKGAMGIAVGGLIVFFGTFLYLIIIGVIGK